MKITTFVCAVIVIVLCATVLTALHRRAPASPASPEPVIVYKVEQLNAAGDVIKEWAAVYIVYNGGYLAAYTNSASGRADIVISAPYRVTRVRQ